MGKTRSRQASTKAREKHPHARGEDDSRPNDQMWQAETPPRTWGRPGIPAFAFTTQRKHPHARGEDRWAGNRSWVLRETPPRTWGRQELTSSYRHNRRNTPTHVGKTVQFLYTHDERGKHPHARGEDNPREELSTP